MTGTPGDHLSAPARGQRAETIALAFLLRKGMTLVTRNFRCRQGEIDLILRDGDVIVFVEVRQRRSSRFGSPAETIHPGKQRRLISAATHFLQSHRDCTDRPCRFDAVTLQTENGRETIEWIRDAFQA